MYKTFRSITFALAFSAASLSFSSCSNSTTEGDHDEHTSPINDSGVNTNENDTAMHGGSNGGAYNMDPEGNGGTMDSREDSMNAGTRGNDANNPVNHSETK